MYLYFYVSKYGTCNNKTPQKHSNLHGFIFWGKCLLVHVLVYVDSAKSMSEIFCVVKAQVCENIKQKFWF